MPSASLDQKVFAIVALLGASIIATVWFAGLESFLSYIPPALTDSSPAGTMPSNGHPSGFASLALDKVLADAEPIFGQYTNIQSRTSTWMSAYPDDTKLVHMNIPGTHDAATWNYSDATQQSLKHVTDLISDKNLPPEWFRCQERSFIDMLNAGIRAFDLRYAQDVTNSTLVFWHGPALQSQTATVEDVLFAFYKWLDDHPSEVLFLSMKYEGNKIMENVDSREVQSRIFAMLTSAAAKKYVLQTKDTFGRLGEARGKIVLLRRFDLDLLPPEDEDSIPGVHFSPQKWTANSPNITLDYNSKASSDDEEGIAYIEDYYHPSTLPNSSLTENIDIKTTAIRFNLLRAASDEHPNGLLWTFASGTNVDNDFQVTPKLMALGNEGNGVNQQLLEWLSTMKGNRLGIVMFDFFEEPEGLVDAFLGLEKP